MLKIAVLLSGNGGTLQNILDHISAGKLNAKVTLVISNKANAYGLERARQAGIYTVIENNDVFTHCKEIDLVCLAGFLKLIKIPENFRGRVMNIHPSLIPSFCGKGYYGHHVHKAVLECGVKITGCTVHFADNEYDHGPIILQRTVGVLDEDTPETLAARVFTEECMAYPEAIRLFANKDLIITGRKVLRRRN